MRTNVKVRLLSVLLTVILCATMLTACGKSSGKRTLSVSFPKTARVTDQGTETITNSSQDRVIVHEDGYIEVCGTMQSGDETYSVQWLYTSDGKPVGSREEQSSGQKDSVFLFDNYFDFVPGEDGVVKVEGNTVYYEDYYEVYDVENDIIREITVFSDGQPGNHFKMNEFGQLMKMELCDSNGVYYELEYTYQEIPVES